MDDSAFRAVSVALLVACSLVLLRGLRRLLHARLSHRARERRRQAHAKAAPEYVNTWQRPDPPP